MEDFEGIRPYEDEEVPGVLARLARDADLQAVVARYLFPRATRLLPALGRLLGSRLLRREAGRLRTVRDVQLLLSGHMGALIENTILDFSVSGVERLVAGTPYLFISTHRDIIMDTGLVNFAIHRAGHATSRIAIGDNLLGKAYAADLMRLNKSFVIDRSVTGAKAVYRALNRTSAFIRASLEAAESVWIAQREGRAKDGLDRTDPALIKMLTLAWRKEVEERGSLCGCVNIVPVAITYELDPCGLRKARELCITDLHGKYDKPDGEDLSSIVEGMLGFKGRVHLHFGIDREIVEGTRLRAALIRRKPLPMPSTGKSLKASRSSPPTSRRPANWAIRPCRIRFHHTPGSKLRFMSRFQPARLPSSHTSFNNTPT